MSGLRSNALSGAKVSNFGGFDSAALMAGIEQCNQPGLPQVDFLIKWNPRATDVCALGMRLGADGSTQWEVPREGKRLTTWDDSVQVEGIARPVRRVLRLTERTINAQGQILLVPDYQLDGWTTSLPAGQFSSADVIALYADHGTHEQFHSEFKTDLDLTRLPSGKFDTNYLVCQLAAVAMNILHHRLQPPALGRVTHRRVRPQQAALPDQVEKITGGPSCQFRGGRPDATISGWDRYFDRESSSPA